MHEIPVMTLQIFDWYRHERTERPEKGVWIIQALESIPVYPSDTKTLALIESLTGMTTEPVTVDTLSSVMIEVQDPSILELDEQLGENSPEVPADRKRVLVTDPKVMEQLIENLYTQEQLKYSGRHVAWEQFEDVFFFQIKVQYKRNTDDAVSMYYPKGKAPIALLEELVGIPLTKT